MAEGTSSLHDAARAGDLAAIRAALVSEPGAINKRDRHSRTPLHLAAWAGQAEAVKLLCEKKADVGASAVDDMAAIHFASQKGHVQAVKELLASGASINARTRKGMTPLHYAVQGNHNDLAVLLVRRGSNLSAKTKAGKTPFDLSKDDEVLEILKAEGLAFKAKKEAALEQEKEAALEQEKKAAQEQEKEARDENGPSTAAESNQKTNEHDQDVQLVPANQIEEPKAKKPKVTLTDDDTLTS